MAISSRLALWEQKIKEEDRSPPPTSPPPIFSVIPGGFIKQLVRETEKESKEAKLKEKIPLNSKEDPPGKVDDGSVIKDTTNLWEAGQGMANSKGQGSLVQGWLNGEGEGMSEIPERKRGAGQRVGSPSCPSDPSQHPRNSFSPEGGKKDLEKVPESGKKVHHSMPWSKQRLESLGKENVKTRAKDEGVAGRMGLRANKGVNKEKTTGETGKKTGENKEKMGDIIGKKLRENEEKMMGEMGKKGGENEKITGKMVENKEKMAGETGKKLGENKEKITGETGKKMRENKEKMMGETEKKMGEKEKTREIIGKKLRENEEKTMGEKGRKPGENKEKTMGETGRKTGENKEKTVKKVIKSKEGTREKVGENKEKTREITGEKVTVETGKKVIETKEEMRETEEKIKEIGGKLEQKSIEETGENEENKVDLGENTDSSEKEDVWYETEKVWLVQKDGFTMATELKPDVGTPELPPGMVRVRIESDGSVFEVDEEQIQKTNPSRFDYAEDLASLVSLNESSIINTLVHRFRSQLAYTYSGPDLIAIEPWSSTTNSSKKAFKGKRDAMPPHIFSVAQKAYWTMLTQRQDQAIIPLGRSGSGKTTCCQNVLEYLVENAGSVDNRVTVEKIQAMFTILQAFGAVSDGHNGASTRFSMSMALDFNAAGRITAAHLQTMLLERIRVAQQPDGEGNFNVFAQMLAGLDLDQRTLLHLHHMTESNSFGIRPPSTAEERQLRKASFLDLQSAFRTLGVGVQEEGALCRVLAAIVHLGTAGAAKVGRKQFLRMEAANEAAEALGCDFEDLSTAVFKHHLRSIIQQATTGHIAEEPEDGPKLTGAECLEGMAAGLYEELFAAVVSLINRSFSSTLLSMASVSVLDLPGFRNPRHERKERAASFEEFCANYAQERLWALFYQRTFASALERYQEESLEPGFEPPGSNPSATLALVDQSPSQVSMASAGKGEEPPKGLLWILEEEALLPGLSDSRAVQRLCSAFNSQEEPGFVFRKCEQDLQFEVGHLLGHDPVRYDAAGWVNKAKWNLSAENATQILQQSRIEAVNELFRARSKIPLVCRSVAGLEGNSQQALQRIGCVRKTFASSFAAVKKKSVCAQIKLQLDALCNLVKRSQIHFVHCLLPTLEAETHPDPTTSWDIPSLRVQLSGGQILDALRLHRIGYSDRMGLAQFRRRFQILAQPLMKKYTSAYEMTDEKKALEELLRALDLEKKSIALGRTQVFLKAGLLSRLEKQRDKVVSPNLCLFQAACKGFLSRQNYRKLKVQRLAIQCIQRNLLSFQRVKAWSWWGLLGRLRPLLTSSLSADQLRAKEEELSILRKKLENSDLHRQNVELLETKVIDLTAELLDERLKAESACWVLDTERSERLKGSREVKDLQAKHEDLRKKLESAEKQLEETQQRLELRELAAKSSRNGEEWQMRLDCAETEIGFLRKRIALLEERLETEQKAKKEIEEKLCGAQSACEASARRCQQWQRKCQRSARDLEDTRLLLESHQNRSHELQKKQKKFDLQLAQALGESAFEKSLREKVTQENTNLQFQLGKTQKDLEEKESEKGVLVKRLEVLTNRVSELCRPSHGLDPDKMAALQKQVWELEESAAKQEEALGLQAKAIEHLEQLHLRLELEIEAKRHLHQKEMEDKEEEMDDLRGACQKKLRQLEMQSEQEAEEKQRMLAEKRDLEGLIATLCEQVGCRDFEAEKRLRRDLKRSRALLADAQLLLQESSSGSEAGSTEAKGEAAKLRRQWEESMSRCVEAQECQKEMAFELEALRLEVEKLTRNKIVVDEQLYQLQHEKADLLKRIDEDQEDLNDLMEKHKALIAQSAKDISQIQDLQAQLEDLKKEKQSLQEKLQGLECRLKGQWSQGSSSERSIVSRQEALIREQESKVAFQDVQVKRLEMLVLRLRESLIRMGEEMERGKESERREKENAGYAWKRMEEMKAQMHELQDRENQAQHQRVQMEKQVDELSAVRQTLQADLETAIRRIADLQAALEEVRSSDEDESDTESIHTAKESLTSRMDTESVGSSSISLNLGPEGSVHSWRSAPSIAWSDLSKDSERRPASGIGANVQREGAELCKSPRSSSSFALSEYVEELRRKRLKEDEWRDSSPNLPIYQTTGASVLRRSRTMQENDESCQTPVQDVQNVQSELAASLQARPWRSSLEEIRELEKPKPALKFGSCESLVQDVRGVQNEASASIQAKPWRSSLEEMRESHNPMYGTCKSLVRDVQSVQNESAAPVQTKLWRSSLEDMRESDKVISGPCKPIVRDMQTVQSESATSLQAKPWKSSLEEIRESQDPVFGLCKPLVRGVRGEEMGELVGTKPLVFQSRRFGREAEAQGDDDFPPAIRTSRSPRREGQRPMSVHFEDEVKALLEPKSDGEDSSSSSSSSGSVVSFKGRRPEGQAPRADRRSEAEGKEDDVHSIMRKYLGKE